MKHRRHLQFLVPIRNTRASPLLVLFAFSGSLLCQARPSETSEARSAPRLAVSPAGSPPVKSSLPAQLAGTQSPGPPVYVEGTFGNDRFDLQTFISKQFTEHGKAGLLSITSAQGRYDNESDSFEFVNVTQLNYDLYKGLSPTLGVALKSTSRFQYVRRFSISFRETHASSRLCAFRFYQWYARCAERFRNALSTRTRQAVAFLRECSGP